MTDQQQTEKPSELTALDKAWGEINALGGYASNETEEAINDTVGAALAILEKHGARDPITVRHTHVAGTTVGKPGDTCAVCGHDFRHEIHHRMAFHD